MDGLKIWDAWCMKSEKYDSKTIQSQWAYFRKQYDNGSNKVSYKKLIEFHILDYPPKNIYEKWYKSNVFMEEMNKICMYYKIHVRLGKLKHMCTCSMVTVA